MKKLLVMLCLLLCTSTLTGCEEALVQAETIVSQIDMEGILTDVIESIDWGELKNTLEKGYDALTEKYPALKGDNIKAFLKDNGLELLNRYISSGDDTMQENARKLGEILKILNPELSDEVDSVIAE